MMITATRSPTPKTTMMAPSNATKLAEKLATYSGVPRIVKAFSTRYLKTNGD